MNGYMDTIGSWVDRRSCAAQGLIMVFASFVLFPILMLIVDAYEWAESLFASGGDDA